MKTISVEAARKEAEKAIQKLPAKVVYDNSMVQFLIKNKKIAEHPLHELRRVYDVASGMDAFGTDKEFSVLEFKDTIWVVPNWTPLRLARTSWRDYLVENRGYYTAYVDPLPEPWRKSFLGGFFRSPAPTAAVLPISEMPDWTLEGPYDPISDPLDKKVLPQS